jgi:hypothetical protein
MSVNPESVPWAGAYGPLGPLRVLHGKAGGPSDPCTLGPPPTNLRIHRPEGSQGGEGS